MPARFQHLNRADREHRYRELDAELPQTDVAVYAGGRTSAGDSHYYSAFRW